MMLRCDRENKVVCDAHRVGKKEIDLKKGCVLYGVRPGGAITREHFKAFYSPLKRSLHFFASSSSDEERAERRRPGNHG